MKLTRARDKNGKHLDVAAALFVRLQSDDATPEDWNAYQKWVSRSQANKEVIEGIETFWDEMDNLAEIPWPLPEECKADTYTGDAPIPIPAAAQITENKGDAVPGYAARLAGLLKPGLNLWSPAAAVALILITFSVFYFTRYPAEIPEYHYRTEVAAHQLITLQDGSELLLGGQSSVRVKYSPDRRNISLDSGEVLFTVAKDTARPFIVRIGAATVRAIGTQFNIRRIPDETVVSVIEGVIHVSTQTTVDTQQAGQTPVPEKSDSMGPPAIQTELTIGQQISLPDTGKAGAVRQANIEDVISWRDGRLVYSGEPLRSVIADINRYSVEKIQIPDNNVGDMLFSGTVRKDEIQDWLNGLEAVFPVKLITRDGRLILLASR